jgi:hypothetical protein
MAPKLSTREAFLQSFIHQEYAVFGRELLPFCLRHWLLLVALKSPLILGGTIELEDMRLAVMVCSTRTNREFFAASRFKSLYWKIWKRFTRQLSVTSALRHFNGYIDDYLPDFPFWKNEADKSEERVPGFFISAARLLSSCTPDLILNMPLGEMLAWNLAKNEADGYPNENLMTEFEVDILRNNPAFREGN